MTIPLDEEDQPAEVDDDVVELKTDAEISPPSKPKSETTKSTVGSMSDNKYNPADTAFAESSPSNSKSTKKKKKKKISRNNNDSNSPAMLDVFNEQPDDKSTDGLENRTVVTTASKKSKGPKKKKKKTNTIDDGAESVDIVSLSSKKSSPKKKKKKRISKDDSESPDVTPDCSSRSLADASVKSSSKKSKSNKSPKSKSKKKKVKSESGSEHMIPDIERSKSLEPVLNQASNNIPKRTMNMEPDNQSNLTIKRAMSLDMADSQVHAGPPMHASRMNNNWSGRGRAHGGRGRGPPPIGRGRGRGRMGPPGGWESRSMRPRERVQNGEMSFAERSSSHERLPYGSRNPSQEKCYGARSLSSERSLYGIKNLSYHERQPYEGRSPSQERLGGPRVANGRGIGPAPRGRRPFDGSPPASSHSLNMYRAPGRPKSILRNSSHHGMLSGSSHHRSIETSSTHSSSQHNRRVCMDLNSESRHSTQGYKYDRQSSFGSEIDSSDIESDGEDDSSFALEDSVKRYPKHVPRTIDRGYSRSLSGLGTNSSHHGHFKATGQSTRSILTIERSEYQNENRFISTLRYIHFLAPNSNEDPIKKKIRIITWCALFCDFLNALVAIITWQGATTKCCEQSVLSALGGPRGGSEDDASGPNISIWDRAIEITTYLYMILIFLEVVPVMRDRFPFNLMNPFIGFLITFAVFFSDSIIEAVSMWVFEAMAVTCEAVNYRLRLQRFAKRKARLKNTKKEIEMLRKIKRKVKNQYDNGGGKVLTRADSAQFVLDLNDSSSFAEDSSFNDDIETNNSVDLNTVAERTAVTTVSNIGTHRETRLLRERRQLIRSQAEDEQDLRIHFFGVVSNIFLVVFSMLMIIVIATNGGMCIKGMRFSNPFSRNQLEICNLCVDDEKQLLLGEDGTCQKCGFADPAEIQCYYPYGIGS